MNWTLFVVCYSIAACFFIALFWPYKDKKAKPTESEKVRKLQTIIDNLRLENEELMEFVPMNLKVRS